MNTFIQFLSEAGKDDWESVFKSLKDIPKQPDGEQPTEREMDMEPPTAPMTKTKTQHPKYRDSIPADNDSQLTPPVSQGMASQVPSTSRTSTSVAPLNQTLGDVVPANQAAWQYVKDLPGYMVQGIKELGRQVFAPLTSTPIEQIQVMANIQGQGPTDQGLMDKVVVYLETNGRRLQDMELDISHAIPGYGAKVRMYSAKGYTFMAVKDHAGKYVYAWKTSNELGSPQERTALPSR